MVSGQIGYARLIGEWVDIVPGMVGIVVAVVVVAVVAVVAQDQCLGPL